MLLQILYTKWLFLQKTSGQLALYIIKTLGLCFQFHFAKSLRSFQNNTVLQMNPVQFFLLHKYFTIVLVRINKICRKLNFFLDSSPEKRIRNSTAQKVKFSIKDFFSKVTKSAVSCGFGHIY